jgi:hypothetical protein
MDEKKKIKPPIIQIEKKTVFSTGEICYEYMYIIHTTFFKTVLTILYENIHIAIQSSRNIFKLYKYFF